MSITEDPTSKPRVYINLIWIPLLKKEVKNRYDREKFLKKEKNTYKVIAMGMAQSSCN